jgi:hypothetical protein
LGYRARIKRRSHRRAAIGPLSGGWFQVWSLLLTPSRILAVRYSAAEFWKLAWGRDPCIHFRSEFKLGHLWDPALLDRLPPERIRRYPVPSIVRIELTLGSAYNVIGIFTSNGICDRYRTIRGYLLRSDLNPLSRLYATQVPVEVRTDEPGTLKIFR